MQAKPEFVGPVPTAINVNDSRWAFAEVIGEPSLRGRPISAGPLLKIIDGFAFSVVSNVIPMLTVNVGVELELCRQVAHGDFVRLEGQLLTAGKTSVTVQITGYRHDRRERAFVRVLSAIVTLVAVDTDGRLSTGLPSLADSTNSSYENEMRQWTAKRKTLLAQWTAAQAAIDQIPHCSTGMVNGVSSDATISVADTLVHIGKVFMPGDLNPFGNVYGGELLRWMDKAAVYCAQSFTQNENVITVAVAHVSLLLPVTIGDMVTFSASVARVSGARLEVAVDAFSKRYQSDTSNKCLTGYFTLANLRFDNVEAEIDQQLAATEDDQRSLRAMLKAERRAELAAEERAVFFGIKSLEVSVEPSRL